MLTYEMRPSRMLHFPAPELVVERVALDRDPAGLTDEADELVDLLLRLRARARGVEDLLTHDRSLDVVRTEVQRDRCERHAHHDPVGLDVRHVVEHQPREREHLEVVRAGRVPPPAPLEDRVLGMERERDEREEAAAAVLLVAQPEDVVDPLLVRLDVAVEHRAVRRDPEPVCGVVDVEPDLRALLAGRYEPAHAVGEDLGAASGKRAQPCVLELAQHVLVREPGERRHVVDLGGRVALEVHPRERLVQRRDRVAVVAEVHVRVLAVDHVDLGEPRHLTLREHVLDELLGAERVRLRLLPGRCERAELALHAADVRLVHVEVLDEVDVVRAAANATGDIGELAEREDVVRLENRHSVLEVEPRASLDLVPDRCQRVSQGKNGDQKLLSTTASARASSSARRTVPSRLAWALLA